MISKLIEEGGKILLPQTNVLTAWKLSCFSEHFAEGTQKCSLPFLSDLELYSVAADKPLCSLTPNWTRGVNLTSWSRTLILLQLGQLLREGKVKTVFQNPDTGGGERCNGLCSLCLSAKSDGWFLSLWHVFLAAHKELEKGRPRAILLSMASAMTSNCKTWPQRPSRVPFSKLGLSAKAVIPSTKVFPLANELWDNSLVILSTSALATSRRLLPSRWALKIVGLKQETHHKTKKKKNPNPPSNKTKTKSEN